MTGRAKADAQGNRARVGPDIDELPEPSEGGSRPKPTPGQFRQCGGTQAVCHAVLPIVVGYVRYVIFLQTLTHA